MAGAMSCRIGCVRKMQRSPSGTSTGACRRRRRWTSERIDVIVAASGDGVAEIGKHWFADGRSGEVPLLVPSRRVARLAAAAGFDHAVVADGAGDDAVMAALTELRGSQVGWRVGLNRTTSKNRCRKPRPIRLRPGVCSASSCWVAAAGAGYVYWREGRLSGDDPAPTAESPSPVQAPATADCRAVADAHRRAGGGETKRRAPNGSSSPTT